MHKVEDAVPARIEAGSNAGPHTPLTLLPELLAPVKAGQRIGLLSEAGCPAIADPGASLVARAHAEGLRVVPLVGPSSLLLALMASGCNGQRFCFHGYLPVNRRARETANRDLETQSLRDASAHLFIETPYRNSRLLEALLVVCRPDTRLCHATDLRLSSESIATRRVAEWRAALPEIDRRPTVFILQAAGLTSSLSLSSFSTCFRFVMSLATTTNLLNLPSGL